MKRIMLVCLTALAVSGTCSLYAQSSGSDFMVGDKSLFEEVTGIKKKTDKFNLYLNMHGDFNMKWNDSGFDQGAFEMKQLRIEMKGDINDWLSYRYRQRLNRGNDGSDNIDNVPTSIDWAGQLGHPHGGDRAADRPDVMPPKIFGGFMRDTNCNFFHNVVSFG